MPKKFEGETEIQLLDLDTILGCNCFVFDQNARCLVNFSENDDHDGEVKTFQNIFSLLNVYCPNDVQRVFSYIKLT